MRYTIGFYNIENLFDVVDDERTLDDTFTVNSPKEWDQKKYTNKLHKIARAIVELGEQTTGKAPALIGLCEVENKKVLEDLIQLTELKDHQYNFIHFDSPDERGIDTALLYQPAHFLVNTKTAHTVFIEDEDGTRDTTRDVLEVFGYLNGAPIYLIVNHWPSKRDNDINAPKRLKAAEIVKNLLTSIYQENPQANILLMGDFNDEPTSPSIKRLNVTDTIENIASQTLFNPMISLYKKGKGTLSYKGVWSLFDQMMFSQSMIKNPRELKFIEANVFDAHFLKEWDGNHKGQPFRTYIGNTYLGGYSDHFPVYSIIEKIG